MDKREEYFEAVQDAVEALRAMNRMRPEMEWYYGPTIASLEWELDNESVAIELGLWLTEDHHETAH